MQTTHTSICPFLNSSTRTPFVNNLPSSTNTDWESPCTSSTEALLFASLLPRAAKKKEGGKGGVTQASPWIRFLPPWPPVIPDLAAAAPPISCPDNGQSQAEPSSGLIGRQWLHSPPPSTGLCLGDRGVTHGLIATLRGTGSDKHGPGPQWMY